MADINDDIAAFEASRQELEAKHTGQWVLIHDRQVIALNDNFEVVVEEAVRRYGRGPYLLRQVGAPPVTLPASVMYHPTDAIDKLRV